MRLKPFRTLSVALVSLFSGCKHGPLVDVCLSFPEKSGFVCVDKGQQSYFLPYEQSSKYVAFSPDDAQLLIQSCGMGKKAKVETLTYLDLVERIASQ